MTSTCTCLRLTVRDGARAGASVGCYDVIYEDDNSPQYTCRTFVVEVPQNSRDTVVWRVSTRMSPPVIHGGTIRAMLRADDCSRLQEFSKRISVLHMKTRCRPNDTTSNDWRKQCSQGATIIMCKQLDDTKVGVIGQAPSAFLTTLDLARLGFNPSSKMTQLLHLSCEHYARETRTCYPCFVTMFRGDRYRCQRATKRR